MSLLQNPKRLAKLLASIQVSHSERPLGPIEVAKEIQAMLAELGNDAQELQNRLPLSSSMISAFARVLTLPENIQNIVSWGESRHGMSGSGEMSFSAAQQLARLESPGDILRLVGTTLSMQRPVTKEEIKTTVSLKRRNPEKGIDECIREVLNVTRTYTVNHFIFISGIDQQSAKTLEAAAQKEGRGPREVALDVLSGTFPPGSVKDVKVGGDHIRVSLSEEGHGFIQSYADENGLSKRSVMSHIISQGAGNGPQ